MYNMLFQAHGIWHTICLASFRMDFQNGLRPWESLRNRHFQCELNMIEFKATYHPRPKTDSVDVLVQYDGVILHVWHLSEPFHRLISSDEFQIAKAVFTRTDQTIKLPNGGRIKTDDRIAFEHLSDTLKGTAGHGTYVLTHSWILALIGSMALAIGLLWLAGK